MQLGDENFSITLFEEQPVRRIWHDGRWFYSVIDAIAILTQSARPRKYWSDMKHNITDKELVQLVSNCLVVKLISTDGKLRETDCLPVKDLVQIIQKVPALHRQKQTEEEFSLGKSGIYAIVNTITGEQYIGSSVDIPARYLQHLSDLRRNKHHSTKLQAAWNQYGEEAFLLIVLEKVLQLSDLVKREQVYLDTEDCPYNTAKLANNLVATQPIEGDKVRRLIYALEQEAGISTDAVYWQHLRFILTQGIVIPGPKYHLLLEAANANILTWESFRDYVAQR